MPPKPLARIAVFFNPDSPDATIELSITPAEPIICYDMATQGDYGGYTSEHSLPAGVTSKITLSPGVYGFVTYKDVVLHNPDPRAITFVTAAGKDPWPTPPPAPKFGGYGADF